MSFSVPDAERYIAFQRIGDIQMLQPGWVVVAVLETEHPMQVYLNNGQQGFGQQKTVDFLVGLPGTREQADLFQAWQTSKNEASFVSSNFDRAKREWEEKEKKLMDYSDHQKRQMDALQEQHNFRVRERDVQAKEVDRLKGEISKLKESIANVMLVVGEHGKASVAEVAEARKVADTLGADVEGVKP